MKQRLWYENDSITWPGYVISRTPLFRWTGSSVMKIDTNHANSIIVSDYLSKILDQESDFLCSFFLFLVTLFYSFPVREEIILCNYHKLYFKHTHTIYQHSGGSNLQEIHRLKSVGITNSLNPAEMKSEIKPWYRICSSR